MALTRATLLTYTSSEMVEIWNKANPDAQIKKFSDRETAIKRILEIEKIQDSKSLEEKKKKPVSYQKKPRQEKEGISFTIKQIGKKEGGVTKEEILAGLVAKFPDRKPESMATTIGLQARSAHGWEVIVIEGQPKRYHFKG